MEVCFGGFRSPQAPAPGAAGSVRFSGGMRVAVVKNASKYFCKSPRFSAERFAKNFAAACRIPGRQLRRASAIFFPHTPIFPAGDARSGVTMLYLYGYFIPRGIAAVVILFANSRSYSSYSSYKSYLNPAPPRSAYRGRSTPTPHLLTTTQPCKR